MSICEDLLGPYHPLHVLGITTLASLLLKNGDLQPSITYFERAITACERIHGHHPLLAKLVDLYTCIIPIHHFDIFLMS
jgi:hypothetical protein